MKKFLITFMASAGITIEAEDEQEAIRKFDEMPAQDLLDELDANGIERTDIFEEEEE